MRVTDPHLSVVTAHGNSFAEPPPDVIDGEEEWEVEAILDSRRKGRTTEYLITWKGYSDSENEWVKEADIAHAEELLSEYKAKHPNQQRPSRRRS